jgi:effector-binding domain-containing protein
MGIMTTSVSVQLAPRRILAAVRRQVQLGHVGSAWRPALDQVWAFLRQNPGLRTDGHNIFMYHHAAKGESIMVVDFGLEVTRMFTQSGEVVATVTPEGRVASALHIGPYERIGETHHAIQSWVETNNLTLAGKSWEIYGDWSDDPARLETRIEYLLA